MLTDKRKLSRWDRNWKPAENDDATYAYRNGYWEELGFDDQEIDEDALEEYEERKRERIARANEY